MAIEFTRDGQLITGGRDQITRLWDQDGKQLMETPPIGEAANDATFCDESNRAIAASAAGAVQVYKAEDGAALGTLLTNPPTLDERLAAAQHLLKEKTDAGTPTIEPVRKAEAELAPVQSALATAQQEAATVQKNVDAITAEVEQINQSRAASDAERTKDAASLAQLQEARPLVAEAIRHLAEALGKSPGDAVLTESQTTHRKAQSDGDAHHRTSSKERRVDGRHHRRGCQDSRTRMPGWKPRARNQPPRLSA